MSNWNQPPSSVGGGYASSLFGGQQQGESNTSTYSTSYYSTHQSTNNTPASTTVSDPQYSQYPGSTFASTPIHSHHQSHFPPSSFASSLASSFDSPRPAVGFFNSSDAPPPLHVSTPNGLFPASKDSDQSVFASSLFGPSTSQPTNTPFGTPFGGGKSSLNQVKNTQDLFGSSSSTSQPHQMVGRIAEPQTTGSLFVQPSTVTYADPLGEQQPQHDVSASHYQDPTTGITYYYSHETGSWQVLSSDPNLAQHSQPVDSSQPTEHNTQYPVQHDPNQYFQYTNQSEGQLQNPGDNSYAHQFPSFAANDPNAQNQSQFDSSYSYYQPHQTSQNQSNYSGMPQVEQQSFSEQLFNNSSTQEMASSSHLFTQGTDHSQNIFNQNSLLDNSQSASSLFQNDGALSQLGAPLASSLFLNPPQTQDRGGLRVDPGSSLPATPLTNQSFESHTTFGFPDNSQTEEPPQVDAHPTSNFPKSSEFGSPFSLQSDPGHQDPPHPASSLFGGGANGNFQAAGNSLHAQSFFSAPTTTSSQPLDREAPPPPMLSLLRSASNEQHAEPQYDEEGGLGSSDEHQRHLPPPPINKNVHLGGGGIHASMHKKTSHRKLPPPPTGAQPLFPRSGSSSREHSPFPREDNFSPSNSVHFEKQTEVPPVETTMSDMPPPPPSSSLSRPLPPPSTSADTRLPPKSAPSPVLSVPPLFSPTSMSAPMLAGKNPSFPVSQPTLGSAGASMFLPPASQTSVQFVTFEDLDDVQDESVEALPSSNQETSERQHDALGNEEEKRPESDVGGSPVFVENILVQEDPSEGVIRGDQFPPPPTQQLARPPQPAPSTLPSEPSKPSAKLLSTQLQPTVVAGLDEEEKVTFFPSFQSGNSTATHTPQKETRSLQAQPLPPPSTPARPPEASPRGDASILEEEPGDTSDAAHTPSQHAEATGLKRCTECQQLKKRSEFSESQLKKKKAMKCKVCCSNDSRRSLGPQTTPLPPSNETPTSKTLSSKDVAQQLLRDRQNKKLEEEALALKQLELEMDKKRLAEQESKKKVAQLMNKISDTERETQEELARTLEEKLKEMERLKKQQIEAALKKLEEQMTPLDIETLVPALKPAAKPDRLKAHTPTPSVSGDGGLNAPGNTQSEPTTASTSLQGSEAPVSLELIQEELSYWVEYFTADGIPYYYHQKSAISIWEPPPFWHMRAATPAKPNATPSIRSYIEREEKKMQCLNCFAWLPAHQKFCGECGSLATKAPSIPQYCQYEGCTASGLDAKKAVKCCHDYTCRSLNDELPLYMCAACDALLHSHPSILASHDIRALPSEEDEIENPLLPGVYEEIDDMERLTEPIATPVNVPPPREPPLRGPHPLVCFGFGGRLITMAPLRRTANPDDVGSQSSIGSATTLLPGPVKIYSISSLLKKDDDTHDLLTPYPGPLLAKPPKTVLGYLDSVISSLETQIADASEEPLSDPHQDDELLAESNPKVFTPRLGPPPSSSENYSLSTYNDVFSSGKPSVNEGPDDGVREEQDEHGSQYGFDHSEPQSNPMVSDDAPTPIAGVPHSIDHRVDPLGESSHEKPRTVNIEALKSKLLLYKMLRTLCAHNGLVSSSVVPHPGQNTDTIKAEIAQWLLEDDSPNSTPPSLLSIPHPLPRLTETSVSHEDALLKLRSHLALGNRELACECAIELGMWEHAFIIALQMGEVQYRTVLFKFTQSMLTPNDPIHSLYTLYSGHGPAPHSHSTPLLDNVSAWRSTLATLITNPRDGVVEMILQLGDSLRHKGDIHAAHICYLCASQLPQPLRDASRMVLVGSEHKKSPGLMNQFKFASNHAIQQTEIVEYARQLHQYGSFLPDFHLYKLLYAYRQAEIGQTSASLHYCHVLGSEIESQFQALSSQRHATVRAPAAQIKDKFSLRFLQHLQDLFYRLRAFENTYHVTDFWRLTLPSLTQQSTLADEEPFSVKSHLHPQSLDQDLSRGASPYGSKQQALYRDDPQNPSYSYNYGGDNVSDNTLGQHGLQFSEYSLRDLNVDEQTVTQPGDPASSSEYPYAPQNGGYGPGDGYTSGYDQNFEESNNTQPLQMFDPSKYQMPSYPTSYPQFTSLPEIPADDPLTSESQGPSKNTQDVASTDVGFREANPETQYSSSLNDYQVPSTQPSDGAPITNFPSFESGPFTYPKQPTFPSLDAPDLDFDRDPSDGMSTYPNSLESSYANNNYSTASTDFRERIRQEEIAHNQQVPFYPSNTLSAPLGSNLKSSYAPVPEVPQPPTFYPNETSSYPESQPPIPPLAPKYGASSLSAPFSGPPRTLTPVPQPEPEQVQQESNSSDDRKSENTDSNEPEDGENKASADEKNNGGGWSFWPFSSSKTKTPKPKEMKLDDGPCDFIEVDGKWVPRDPKEREAFLLKENPPPPPKTPKTSLSSNSPSQPASNPLQGPGRDSLNSSITTEPNRSSSSISDPLFNPTEMPLGRPAAGPKKARKPSYLSTGFLTQPNAMSPPTLAPPTMPTSYTGKFMIPSGSEEPQEN